MTVNVMKAFYKKLLMIKNENIVYHCYKFVYMNIYTLYISEANRRSCNQFGM